MKNRVSVTRVGQRTVLCVDNTPYGVMQCLNVSDTDRWGHCLRVAYLDQMCFKVITFAETK